LAGHGRLVFVRGDSEPKTLSESPSADTTELVSALSICNNREDAQVVLNRVESKDRLVSLARAMKVHTVKNDRREDIENKIITFAIGGKLRTEALSTLNLGSGSGGAPAD
jgi:hypothetical protein